MCLWIHVLVPHCFNYFVEWHIESLFRASATSLYFPLLNIPGYFHVLFSRTLALHNHLYSSYMGTVGTWEFILFLDVLVKYFIMFYKPTITVSENNDNTCHFSTSAFNSYIFQFIQHLLFCQPFPSCMGYREESTNSWLCHHHRLAGRKDLQVQESTTPDKHGLKFWIFSVIR